MPFGPYILKKSYIEGASFVLELADSEGNVRYRPRRFVSFSRHEFMYAKAKRLEGRLVTTETSNPHKNPPEQWWVDVNEFHESSIRNDTPDICKPALTKEQLQCIESFQIASQLKISAFAGTGKTTTLLGIANSVPNKKGLYLAFNKEIADEAVKKFPKNVECRTTHSLAYQYASNHFSREKLGGGINAIRVAELLELKPVSFGENRNFSSRQVGQWIVDTVKNFCQSDSESLDSSHVECGRIRFIKELSDRESFINFLLQAANFIWSKSIDSESSVPLGHDGYLKLWSMSQPLLEYDFIMLDEAQDTNAAVIHALSKQRAKTVYVGDKYQQIYGFRGAFNAMEKIHVDSESSLTTSFRFGDPIAEIANAIIRRFGEQRKIVGNENIPSKINSTPAKAFIYRTNIGMLDGLVDAISKKQRPFLAGGTSELRALVHDIELMQSGHAAISNGDFFGFNHWLDLVGFSRSEEGSSFQTIVQIVERFGLEELGRMLDEVVPSSEQADVILTTAHKSKGKEWDHVEVCDDFASKIRIDNLQIGKYTFDHPLVEEITLLYVALTRAKYSLNIPDQILSILQLQKFIRGPFPDEAELVTQVTPVRGNQSASSSLHSLSLPKLPDQFKPKANSQKARDDFTAEITSTLHLAEMNRKLKVENSAYQKPENLPSTAVSLNKLQALQEKFTK